MVGWQSSRLFGAAAFLFLGFGVTGWFDTPVGAAPAALAAPPAEDARASVAGISVATLAMDEWPGPARITKELTPVKIRIENGSAQPLLVSYQRFRLAAADGSRYRALPLFRIAGSAPAAMKLRDPVRVRVTHFRYRGFQLAPYYAQAYPDIAAFDAPFPGDPAVYALYDSYYEGKPLPTTEMRRRGLAEGVLAPGGYAEGYLYFEEVPSSANRVTLEYDLVNARTGAQIGEIRIVDIAD